jgi:hypothetical protein
MDEFHNSYENLICVMNKVTERANSAEKEVGKLTSRLQTKDKHIQDLLAKATAQKGKAEERNRKLQNRQPPIC